MSSVARLVAVALMAAAAVVAAPGPAAYAAPCGTDSGVTVVVDFNQLGGGVQQACVAGGGGDAASSLFPAAGFTLKYAQRQPGFVCRVNGVPQSDPCVNTAPADAFWSLWWSPGDGSWKYASVGAGSLNIPDGGFVAFSWDQVAGNEPPSAGATTPQPPAPQQPSPDQPGGDGGSGGNGSEQPAGPGGSSPRGTSPSSDPGTSPSAAPDTSPADDPSGKGGKGKKRKGNPEASPGTPTSAPTTTAPAVSADEGSAVADPSSESGGLPGWVAPVLIGLLFMAAGVVVFLRRRRSGTVGP